MTNTNDEERRQTPEETLNRISGVPKTPEEQKAEAEELAQERARIAQASPTNQPAQPEQTNQANRPAQPPHVETEEQRQKP